LTHAHGVTVLASYHPSAILRAENERAALLRDMLIADLRRAAALGEAR
jgi:uracil-DNA glycosylase